MLDQSEKYAHRLGKVVYYPSSNPENNLILTVTPCLDICYCFLPLLSFVLHTRKNLQDKFYNAQSILQKHRNIYRNRLTRSLSSVPKKIST